MTDLKVLGLDPATVDALRAFEVLSVEDLLALAEQDGDSIELCQAAGWSPQQLRQLVKKGMSLVPEMPRRARVGFGAF